jgi:cytochrome c-type biogenesis protein
MHELFTSLTHAVEGAPAIALLAALAWGVFSIILSPCHLASIPLIVGFIGERGRVSTGQACLLSTLFAVGILLSIALIGVITALAGRLMGDLGPYGNWFVALIFFAIGLHLLGVITIPLPGAHQPGMQRKGHLAAFLLGLVFGIALGPCTFAFMAPMLGVTFRLASTNLPYALLLLLVYGIGHCLVIIIAGTSTEWVQRFLDWNENSKGLILLKRACGLLVILAGLFLVYTA